MVACLHGNPKYVQDLLKVPGIKVDLQNDRGLHALMCACGLGQIEVIRAILDAFPDPRKVINLAKEDGRTPLMFASVNGHTEVVSLLLQKGAHFNMQAIDDGQSISAIPLTPLHFSLAVVKTCSSAHGQSELMFPATAI